MTFSYRLRFVFCTAVLPLASLAQAELLTSSASSAGSASSASVSDSLSGSSNSSRDTSKTADGDYRITDVSEVPGRTGIVRVNMQTDGSQEGRIVLDLPLAVLKNHGLGRGDLVRAKRRVYGLQFARASTREAFFLVLADDWHGELAPRPVVIL